jgi:nucleoside-triphosphatase
MGSANIAKRHLLLTGVPGSGKSTAIRRLADLLEPKPRGFYTEELREGGERRGFRLVGFEGSEALIAHVTLPKTHRVSKYGVDLRAIDEAVQRLLAGADRGSVYLVDEIGKMECLSERFVGAMRRLLDSKAAVVATVASRGSGFIAEVKKREDCELWTLTRANRTAMPERMLAWLREPK